MRQAGYYWVYEEEVWTIAFWSKENLCWYVIGVENPFQDSDFSRIDEDRISYNKE